MINKSNLKINRLDLKEFLDEKVNKYNTIDFIADDPISIPHRYSLKEDIEIASFLASSIAWGNRKMITKNGHRMMDLLGDSPYDFVMSHQENHLERLEVFVHRTFNGGDFKYFIKAIKDFLCFSVISSHKSQSNHTVTVTF